MTETALDPCITTVEAVAIGDTMLERTDTIVSTAALVDLMGEDEAPGAELRTIQTCAGAWAREGLDRWRFWIHPEALDAD